MLAPTLVMHSAKIGHPRLAAASINQTRLTLRVRRPASAGGFAMIALSLVMSIAKAARTRWVSARLDMTDGASDISGNCAMTDYDRGIAMQFPPFVVGRAHAFGAMSTDFTGTVWDRANGILAGHLEPPIPGVWQPDVRAPRLRLFYLARAS